MAQVTVDLHALDALSPDRHVTRQPAPRRPPPPPKHVAAGKPARPPAHATTTPTPATPPPTPEPAPAAPSPAVASAPAAAPPPAAPALPTAVPPTLALAPVPPPAPPSAQSAPPPPPPISDASATAARPTTTGLRVTFATGQTDLSPDSAAAIKNIVKTAPAGDTTSFNVVAYAAGTPEDPSTARRLSLSRALAVRSALMAGGVSSARIYVRALGAASGDDAPDRVDLAVMGGNASGAPAQQQ